jgi:hypothetical protein
VRRVGVDNDRKSSCKKGEKRQPNELFIIYYSGGFHVIFINNVLKTLLVCSVTVE